MSETTPTFAIAVPVGSWTPRLAATLRSLARQSPRPNVALMDASGDPRVATLADTFDDLLTVRRHGPDDGQSGAILDGWSAIDGDVIGWLNADDYLAPDALSRVARALAESGADAVTGQSLILDETGAPREWHPAVRPVDALIRKSCVVSQPSCFVRRDAVERVGGLDRAREYTMDWDLWVRLYDGGARFVHVDEALSAVVWAPGTKTASLPPRRLSEIASIVARNESSITVLKSLAGFSMNHLFTYVAPGLRALNARPRSGSHGLSAYGDVAGAADLEIFHEDDGHGGLVLDVEGGPLSARIRDRAGATLAEGASAERIELPAALPAGAPFRLEVEAAQPARLVRIRWRDDAADARAVSAAGSGA